MDARKEEGIRILKKLIKILEQDDFEIKDGTLSLSDMFSDDGFQSLTIDMKVRGFVPNLWDFVIGE
jgi:hypothetical protein